MQRIYRKWSVQLLPIVFCLVALLAWIGAQNKPNIYSTPATRAVFYIGHDEEAYVGSGVAVAPNLVLTAAHVLALFKQEKEPEEPTIKAEYAAKDEPPPPVKQFDEITLVSCWSKATYRGFVAFVDFDHDMGLVRLKNAAVNSTCLCACATHT